jgi:hypothetical protein
MQLVTVDRLNSELRQIDNHTVTSVMWDAYMPGLSVEIKPSGW